MVRNEQFYLYHNEPNGCPSRLLDESGKVVWAARYDAWGKVKRLVVNEVEQPLRLQGLYFDEETGLHYNRFRYYCAEIGSFVSQDPLGLVAGENVYAFGPNAQGWIDPLGLACKSAVENLPTFKGKPHKYIKKKLEKDGFVRTKKSSVGNETWEHPDGSSVRIDPYGNKNTAPWKTANNAHVHKYDAVGNKLNDRGIVSSNPNDTHIGISNPPDLPTVRARPHGAGTL